MSTSQPRSGRHLPASSLFAAALLAGVPYAGAGAARAAAFDIIVPSHVTIDTEGSLGIGLNGGWAWLVATSETLTAGDIEGMTASLVGDLPGVSPSAPIFNASQVGPLEPGEAAGGSVGFGVSPGTLLEPGETRVRSLPFLNAGFGHPAGFSGAGTFTGTYQIGPDVVTYTVEVTFAPGVEGGFDAMQRVSSVPWEARFIPLGQLVGGTASEAEAVSADARCVAGTASTPQTGQGFRWTAGGGLEGLGFLPGGEPFGSQARDVSADGSVVVGSSAISPCRQDADFCDEAYRWTAAGGMVGLGQLAGSASGSTGSGVSADGSVVVGGSGSLEGPQAFRWTSEAGMTGLGDLPGGIFSSVAFDVSADGIVVVGRGASEAGTEAFLWTPGLRMVGLGDLAGGAFGSSAVAVSADGATVVGHGTSATGDEAFRWTSREGMVGLGIPAGSTRSHALGVSGDGRVVVGFHEADFASRTAFVWDEAHGVRDVADVLAGLGVDLTGWTLREARDVTAVANELVIVGVGRNPEGQFEAWLATLPEPSSATLGLGAAVALAALCSWRRPRP